MRVDGIHHRQGQCHVTRVLGNQHWTKSVLRYQLAMPVEQRVELSLFSGLIICGALVLNAFLALCIHVLLEHVLVHLA